MAVLDTQQPDFSLDVQDNGRLCFVVLGLTKSSSNIAREITEHLTSLPPFQVPGRDGGVVSLRFLTALPHWSRHRDKKSIVFGSKRVYGFLGIALCHDPDDLLEAESNYKSYLDIISDQLMTNRCLVFGNRNELERSLKGQEAFVLIQFKKDNIVQSCSDKLLEILTHSVALVHSNLKLTVSSEQLLKKTGSLSSQVDGSIINEDQQKHQHARLLKTKADLYLLLGQYSAAVQTYNEAFLLLRQMKEYHWLASSLEGLISTRLLMSTQHDTLLSLSDAYNDTDSSDQISTGNQDTVDSADTVLSVDSSSSQIDTVDPVDMTDISDVLVTGDNIDKNFQSALNFYDKASNIGDKKSRIELSLKYSYYLIQQKNYSKACRVLNEVLGTDLIIDQPSLKLSLYLALSSLYIQMKYSHKTLFMLVTAARLSMELAMTDLGGDLTMKAYNLLDYCVSGQFDTTLDSNVQPAVKNGWPLLQAVMIRDYTTVCMKLGYTQLFFKWSWLLLQSFHSYLSQEDITTITDGLKQSVTKINESNVTESSDSNDTNSVVSAPFSLTSIPHVAVFKPQLLAPLLTVRNSVTLFPSLLTPSDSSQGPFLLSMIGKKSMKKKAQQEVLWVQGDPAEVLLIVSNPLPLELKVEKMTISLDGAKATSYPSNISLPANCVPQEFVLLCIPWEPGTISISGYTAQIFGLSNSSSTNSDCIVKVIPSLPQLRVRVFPRDHTPRNALPTQASGKKRSMSALEYFELLDGEIYQCDLQLQSIGDVPVESVKMSLKEQSSDYCQISWEEDKFVTLFPLSEKNKMYHFPLTINVIIPDYLRIGSCKVLNHSMFKQQPQQQKLSSSNSPHPSLTLPIKSQVSPEHNYQQQSSASSRMNDLHSNATLTITNETRKESTPSILSSPSKWARRTGGGSLRRSKPSTKEKVTPKSDLLESLDLNHPSNNRLAQTLQPKMKPKLTSALVTKRESLSPRRSPSSLQRTITLVRPIPIKQSSPSPQHKRLMDSLNLEPSNSFSPSEDTTHPPTQQQTTPSSNQATSSEDRSSVRLSTINTEDIDFEGPSDRTSIKSDPGIDIVTSPPVSPSINKPSPISTTSSSSSSSQTLGFLGSYFTGKNTTRKKRPVGPQFSVPIKPTLPVITSLIKPSISHPTGAQKARRSPQEKIVKTVLLLQYTGGDGAKEGYYRELTLEVTSNIKPTLVFDDFAISPIKGCSEEFSFDMLLENVSSYPLNVTIDINQDDLAQKRHQYTLDSCADEQISLPMKKFRLPDKDDSVKEANVIKHYCEHIVNLLTITWRTPTDKCGVLTLKGLQLPQSSLSIIRPLPVLFDVCMYMNGQAFSPGSTVTVSVTITNNTSGVLPSSLITLSPFTLSPSGHKINSVGSHLLYTQSLSQWIPQLAEEESHSFAVFLIFLYPNEYLIDITHYIIHDKPIDKKDNTQTPSSLVESSLPNKEVAPLTGEKDIDRTNTQKETDQSQKGTDGQQKETKKETDKSQKETKIHPKETDKSQNIKQNSLKGKPCVVKSPVIPIMTSSTSSLPPAVTNNNNPVIPVLNDAGSRNNKGIYTRPTEFMTKAESYIGPQLTINIK